jgi:long-subunit acyl-CoA synthetase (AMP-forming)
LTGETYTAKLYPHQSHCDVFAEYIKITQNTQTLGPPRIFHNSTQKIHKNAANKTFEKPSGVNNG